MFPVNGLSRTYCILEGPLELHFHFAHTRRTHIVTGQSSYLTTLTEKPVTDSKLALETALSRSFKSNDTGLAYSQRRSITRRVPSMGYMMGNELKEGRIPELSLAGTMIRPGKLVVIRRGPKFKVELPDSTVRGCRLYATSGKFPVRKFTNARDFGSPIASFEVDQSPWENLEGGHFLASKITFRLTLSRMEIKHTPSLAGDFAAFVGPRWDVTDNSYRLPYFRRNSATEFIDPVSGAHEGRSESFRPDVVSYETGFCLHGGERLLLETTLVVGGRPLESFKIYKMAPGPDLKPMQVLEGTIDGCGVVHKPEPKMCHGLRAQFMDQLDEVNAELRKLWMQKVKAKRPGPKSESVPSTLLAFSNSYPHITMQARPEPPVPEQPKSTDLKHAAASDDPQYPKPVEASESTPPTTNPRFPIFGFPPLMTEYTHGGRSYLTVSPELPSTLPPSYPTPLTALPMDEIPEKITSGAPRSSRPGSYSSSLTSVPRSMSNNPIGCIPSVVHSGRGRKGRPTKHEDSTDNDSDPSLAHTRAAPRAPRHQEARRPRIGSERRRRGELRASYHRLKDTAPTHGLSPRSHQRPPSKIALLDHATACIDSLEKSRQQLLAKIREVEEEADRLRHKKVLKGYIFPCTIQSDKGMYWLTPTPTV
ncbi:hypothetical protein BJY52DRAFT_1224945 [Lactarius psammicola]|nr:hypothetical protein BJY52DRAFT_1224945 [Lactarius psammicola]